MALYPVSVSLKDKIVAADINKISANACNITNDPHPQLYPSVYQLALLHTLHYTKASKNLLYTINTLDAKIIHVRNSIADEGLNYGIIFAELSFQYPDIAQKSYNIKGKAAIEYAPVYTNMKLFHYIYVNGVEFWVSNYQILSIYPTFENIDLKGYLVKGVGGLSPGDFVNIYFGMKIESVYYPTSDGYFKELQLYLGS